MNVAFTVSANSRVCRAFMAAVMTDSVVYHLHLESQVLLRLRVVHIETAYTLDDDLHIQFRSMGLNCNASLKVMILIYNHQLTGSVQHSYSFNYFTLEFCVCLRCYFNTSVNMRCELSSNIFHTIELFSCDAWKLLSLIGFQFDRCVFTRKHLKF